MTSRNRHENKQAMREQAQKDRALQAAKAVEKATAATELFPQPVKVYPKVDDPTAELAKNVLGDWEQFQPSALKSSWLGVPTAPGTPGTPQPNKVGKHPLTFPKPGPNGVHTIANKKVGPHKASLHGAALINANHCVKSESASRNSESAGKLDHRHKWPSTSHADTKVKTDNHVSKTEPITKENSNSSPVKPVKSHDKIERDKSRDRSKSVTLTNSNHNRHTPQPWNSFHHKDSQRSSSESGNKDASLIEPNKLASPPLPSPSGKTIETKQSKDTHSNKSPCREVKPENSMAPPNGTMPINGITKKGRHVNLPKIQIQLEGKCITDPSSSVDDIIKEMTLIDTPLTGISTPHKEKNFPFPGGNVDLSSVQIVTKPLMESNTHKRTSSKTQGQILTDLELSESESEGEEGTVKNESETVKNERETNGIKETSGSRVEEVGERMSSSDSDSEESSGSSSGSGSDSESSPSEGEEDATHTPPKDNQDELPKPSPDNTSNSPSEQPGQQKPRQNWSLKNFLAPTSSTNSIIGGDLMPNDSVKDPVDTASNDLSNKVSKSSWKSRDLISDFSGELQVPGLDNDLLPPVTSKQSKKEHKSSKHKHRTSSSAGDHGSKHPERNGSESPITSMHKNDKSPARAQEKTTKTTTTTTKRAYHRKNSDKSPRPSKLDNNRTTKVKDVGLEVKVPISPVKAKGKSGVSKPEGRPRGRPRSKPKTPVLLDSESSSAEEEPMDIDVDVVSISPEKKPPSLEVLRRNSSEKSSVTQKIDFSTPPRDETPKPNINASPSSNSGGKRKDSARKEKTERKKHDKQSEDKRKIKSSLITDIENSKYSSQEKDIDMCNLDTVVKESNFRILSPIPSFPPKSIPGVSYCDGKPSIVVRLNFSLLDRIPPKDTDLKSPESGISTMSSSSSNPCSGTLSNNISSTLDITDIREEDGPPDILTDTLNDSAVEDIGDLPKLASVKSELKSESKSAKDTSSDSVPNSNSPAVISNASIPDPSEDIISQLWDSKPVLQKRKRKYPKDGETKSVLSNLKSEKKSTPLPITESKLSDEKEAFGKSPAKNPQRRSSTSSNSSHKERAKRRKCDLQADIKPVKNTSVSQDSVLENGKTGSFPPNSYPHIPIPLKRQKLSHQKLLPSEEYILEGKKHKHEADCLGDKKPRSLIYTEAVLAFILSGYAMEHEHLHDSRYFRMYSDTLLLLKGIHSGKFKNSHPDPDNPSFEKQVLVLSLRIQSLLCLKLFKLKKTETLRLKSAIDEQTKGSSKPTASAPSPHQTNWNNRVTGTPSPMSPTPSPAGSIGSVGSQSSNCDVNPSKLANGNLGTGAVSSSVFVNVNPRIHSLMSQYINHASYLVQAHDLWDQGDAACAECSDFFEKLELQTSALTLHSSIWDLVHYVRQGLQILRDT